MNPKKIENLDPAANLQDNDLLFASVRDGGTEYVSKKVTLGDIANYVRSGMEVVPGGNGFGGYEIYDLPESDDGPIEEYESNSQRNYISGLTISTLDGAQLDSLTKTYSKNCEVLMTPLGGIPIEDNRGYVKIDKVQIPTVLLSLGDHILSQFYVKAGQTLSIEYSGGTANINVRPLKSGGNFFIDGSSELQEPFTSLSSVDTSTGTTFTFTAPKQTLFAWCFPIAGSGAGFGVTLNGKDIHWKDHENSWWYDKLILDTGDTIKFTFGQSYITYCALPLLEAGGGSPSSNEDLNVQLIDNHDSNVIDLEVTQSPENSTITYFVNSNYQTSNASWVPLVDNKATITFNFQTDKDKKYVFFKVSQNGQDFIYMMQLMQNYYATQSGDTAYDIKIGKIAYAGNPAVNYANGTSKAEAENLLLQQLPSMTGKNAIIYNAQTKDWDVPENVNQSNVSNFVFIHRTVGQYYYWVCKVGTPQTSSGAYTYLHSIILQLSYFGD